MNVKFKRLHPDAKIPQYATEMAAGFDLVAVEDVIIAPGETAKVPLGFAVQIPPGYEIQIRPRSGVTLKTKLRVNLGTIDADYRGEVGVITDNIAVGDNFLDYTYGLVDGKYSTDDGNGGETVYEAVYEDLSVYYVIRKGDRIAQGVLAEVSRASFEEVAELDDTVRGDGGFGHTGVNVI
ncbi:dUTP diphosphatase [Paenibacillus illinoisensis]|uniref:dUTP diphosphatase n=1 Tax=Paenibacillus illinoisensis TaxID=59845 RepID=UPI00203E9311|nr:deoxyuridine 5'-triphosphate nucleotidohydrolase [Paenibacillus illinoisensis]